MKQRVHNLYQHIVHQKEIVIAIAIAIVLSGLTVGLFLRDQKHPPLAQKNDLAVNTTVSSGQNTQEATKGGEIDWRKSVHMTNESSNVDGTIIEAIDENQDFAGSLQLPPGWTASYSCDARGTAPESRTYVATPSTSPCTGNAAVTYIKISTGTAQTLKPYSQTPITQPLTQTDLNNGSYKTLSPIMYQNKVFQIMQAVNVQDAGSTNDYTLNCFDLTTYTQCAGFPTYMSTTVGPLGTGTKNINTPLNAQTYLDSNTGKLYIPGQTSNNYGVVCVDLGQLQNCGFTSLGINGSTPPAVGLGNPVVLSGFVESGGKLYGHANDKDKTNQTVVCYDIAANAACTGFTANTVASTQTVDLTEHRDAYLTTGTHVIEGTRLYWIVDYSTLNINATRANFCHGVLFSPTDPYTCDDPAYKQRSIGTVITCFDVNTKAHCTGWPNVWGGIDLFNTGGGIYVGKERPTTLFTWRNPDETATAKGICLMIGLSSGVDPGLTCYNKDNGTVFTDVNGTPGHPAKMFPTGWMYFYWTGAPNITNVTDSEGAKTYFAFYNTADNGPIYNTYADAYSAPQRGGTMCWNWKTGSNCAGWPSYGPRYWYEINSANSGDKGYFYDGSCMWGVGYGSKMWSFDAKTGEAPCRALRTKYTATLTPTNFYCDGEQHAFGWGKLRLAKASLYDFDNFNVTVKSTGGATLLQQNLKSNDQLDLSSINIADNPQLSVEINATVFNTSPWANGNLPYVNVITKEQDNDAQYCYKTTAKHYCDIDKLYTQSAASVVTDDDTLTTEPSSSINLNQPENEQCFKDVKVGISSDKTEVNAGDNITYNIDVTSKANLNMFDRGNVLGARLEATLPTGFSYVSSNNGGSLEAGKIVWDNQDILAAQVKTYTVTMQAPNSVISMLKKPDSSKVYAATVQSPVVMQAVLIYDDDYYPADNSSQDNAVTLITTTPDTPPDNGGGGNTGGGDNGGGDTGGNDGSNTGGGTGGTDGGNTGNTGGGTTGGTDNGTTGGGGTTTPTTPTTPNTPTPEPTLTLVLPDGSQRTISTATPTPENLTPSSIRSVLAPSLQAPTESFFKAVNAAVTPIPNTVAVAIPYGAIAFLAAFAAIYLYQGIQEARARRQMNQAFKRYRRTEDLRRNYIDLTSHYLNTPIATMNSTLDLLTSQNQLPESTNSAAKQRLHRLVEHVQALLGVSQEGSSDEKAAAIVNPETKKRSILSPAVVLPILAVFIVAIIINAAFVWADKYSASVATLAIQASYYILSAVALIVGFTIFRNQRFATAVAENELTLEKQLSSSQTEFITSSSKTLQEDIVELEQLAPAITAAPKGKSFGDGLTNLKSAIAKLTYLNALTTHNIVPTIPDQTIKDLADEVVANLQPLADKQGVQLDVTIEPGLTVLVDIDGFKQILTSTLDNAIKFNQTAGKASLTIARHDKKNISVIVRDTGHGIPKDKIDRLFQPFGRATDSRKFNFEGFGLDLYMDKLIAEQCGGSISVQSEEGVGTTVTVILPS